MNQDDAGDKDYYVEQGKWFQIFVEQQGRNG